MQAICFLRPPFHRVMKNRFPFKPHYCQTLWKQCQSGHTILRDDHIGLSDGDSSLAREQIISNKCQFYFCDKVSKHIHFWNNEFSGSHGIAESSTSTDWIRSYHAVLTCAIQNESPKKERHCKVLKDSYAMHVSPRMKWVVLPTQYSPLHHKSAAKKSM